MSKSPLSFDWADLAFSSKKPLRELNAIFIAAPREMSAKRFTQIIKTYLPQGNILLGVSKEAYVEGFEGQPQFRMLDEGRLDGILAASEKATSKHHIYAIRYFQRELPFLIEKLGFQKVLLVNGSWRHVFHNSAAYYALTSKGIPFEFISPFVDQQEGFLYEARVLKQALEQYPQPQGIFNERQMLDLASQYAKFSYDYSYQTGAVLGKRSAAGQYQFILGSFNQVVPTQSYALHFGSSREKHFSPPHDLNHYDAVHAEVEMLIFAQRKHIDLQGTTMFINLLPCPTCARMLTQTDIAEFVYTTDHSDGYAIKMLETVGKQVRRIVL